MIAKSQLKPVGILLGLCCGIGGLLALAPGPADSLWWAYLLLGALFVVALAPMVWELRTGRFDFFNPKNLFVLYYLLQLGVYSLYVFISGKTVIPWMRPDTDTNRPFYAAAVGLSVLGLLAFYLGYSLKLGGAIGRCLPSWPCWDARRVWIVMGGAMALGCVATIVLFRSQGGFQEFQTNLSVWRGNELVGKGFLIYPATGMMSTAAILPFFLVLNERRNTQYWTLFFAFVVFGFSLIPGLLLGFRIYAVFPLLQLMALWHYRRKPLSFKQIAFFGLFLLVFLTLYGLVREGVGRGQPWVETFTSELPDSEAFLRPVILRSPGTEIVVSVMQTLADTGDFEYGWRAVVEAATILIPRALLPTKIESAGPRFGAQFFWYYLYWRAGNVSPTFTGGWPPTPVGYFYWQFGWPGVLLGMLLLGIAAKTAYHYVRVDPRDRTRMLLYTTFVSSFPYFAESPQDALNGLVVRMVFAVGFLILLTARRGPSP